MGTIPHPSPPYRSEEGPIKISNPAPTLGQHNELVLSKILELSEAEIKELTGQGIIGTKPRLA